jgi:hypothetical protein
MVGISIIYQSGIGASKLLLACDCGRGCLPVIAVPHTMPSSVLYSGGFRTRRTLRRFNPVVSYRCGGSHYSCWNRLFHIIYVSLTPLLTDELPQPSWNHPTADGHRQRFNMVTAHSSTWSQPTSIEYRHDSHHTERPTWRCSPTTVRRRSPRLKPTKHTRKKRQTHHHVLYGLHLFASRSQGCCHLSMSEASTGCTASVLRIT